MSEMTLFKSGNTLPAHLRNLQLDETTRALMGGAGSGGGKRISIRGNVFRMIVDGKEIAQNEDRSMNIIVVAANQHVSRSYYAETYEEGKKITWKDGFSAIRCIVKYNLTYQKKRQFKKYQSIK
jgi:aspartate-semialdehyde dehydrogenase